ncbi:hypothetical protein BX070DRAFT_225153 [Coemansia spiralis]|nr:hypothetical protein BX070DRAFT_225153 [Coemansia spiralis]
MRVTSTFFVFFYAVNKWLIYLVYQHYILSYISQVNNGASFKLHCNSLAILPFSYSSILFIIISNVFYVIFYMLLLTSNILQSILAFVLVLFLVYLLAQTCFVILFCDHL